MKPKLSLLFLIVFYLAAGVNHFRDPDFYMPLIPDYIPYPETINLLSGWIEMLLGLGLVFQTTRRYAAYLIIAMLVAFIPSHVHFIVIGSCIPDGLCVPQWLGWARLVVIHPILIYSAWSCRNTAFSMVVDR